jgi:hypothetical protein
MCWQLLPRLVAHEQYVCAPSRSDVTMFLPSWPFCPVLCCAVLCCGAQACVIKVHMLMLAHLERLGDEVPAALQADLK